MFWIFIIIIYGGIHIKSNFLINGTLYVSEEGFHFKFYNNAMIGNKKNK